MYVGTNVCASFIADDKGAGRKKAVSSAPPIASLAFVAPRVHSSRATRNSHCQLAAGFINVVLDLYFEHEGGRQFLRGRSPVFLVGRWNLLCLSRLCAFDP